MGSRPASGLHKEVDVQKQPQAVLVNAAAMKGM